MQTITSRVGLILSTASRALQQILYAANRQHRNDEKKCDELHSLLADEIADGATLATAHLRGLGLRAPRKKVCADNEKAEKHFGLLCCQKPNRRKLLQIRIESLHPAPRLL